MNVIMNVNTSIFNNMFASCFDAQMIRPGVISAPELESEFNWLVLGGSGIGSWKGVVFPRTGVRIALPGTAIGVGIALHLIEIRVTIVCYDWSDKRK